MWEDTDGADPEAERVRKVGSALRNICLNEFGSTWSNDVAEKFAKAAIAASSTPAADAARITPDLIHHDARFEGAQPSSASWQIRVEALRAAATLMASYNAFGGNLPRDVVSIESGTRDLAKRFERYLETGD